jgi:glutathionyl-hydroquinone reductase
MKMLIKGEWIDRPFDAESKKGEYLRLESGLRNWVTADGSAGPSGEGGFEAEADRYHLYVSHACPWANRTLIVRKLKKLESLIGVSVVDPFMMENGWEFNADNPATTDQVNGASTLADIYRLGDSDYTGRVTVPVLWDKKLKTIVSNESSEIIRMFNSAFNHITGDSLDLYPEAVRNDIDEVNGFIYSNINNGVYKTGFATRQAAYDKNLLALFDALDEIDNRLEDRRYLMGDKLTEADVRLFTTLVRFDAVYVGHFKCNMRRIADYANLSAYLRDLFQTPCFGETVNFDHIKAHYYGSHLHINPFGIIPDGPILDLESPHNRAMLAV